MDLGTGGGRISGKFDPRTGNLHIDNVRAGPKEAKIGTKLYGSLIDEAKKQGEVKSVSGFMSDDNNRALLQTKGDISQTPHARIAKSLASLTIPTTRRLGWLLPGYPVNDYRERDCSFLRFSTSLR